MVSSILLQIAKTAILSLFEPEIELNKDSILKKYPYLNEFGASFVTLTINDKLRGCIGSISAHQPLIDDIINNATLAAFNDPRFETLNISELTDELCIEVSILSKPQKLDYINFEDLKHKIRPNIDGLILTNNIHQGTFLPQVWLQLPNAELFLEHLAYKAGADIHIYDTHPEIFTYQVEHIKKRYDAILPL